MGEWCDASILFQNRCSITVIFGLLMVLFCACQDRNDKHTIVAKNKNVQAVMQEIKKLDFVKKTEIEYRGFSLILDIYVQSAIQPDEQERIESIVQENFGGNAAKTLQQELETDVRPDVCVYIRNENGAILVETIGSCYATSDRTGKPDCDFYNWRTEWWEQEKE